jgi:Leucine-rich repeat (LRR) protein
LFVVICFVLNGAHAQEEAAMLQSKQILDRVFGSTSGLSWTHRDNWLEASNICEFYGITCYNGTHPDQRRLGHVQKIDLSYNHLVGSLPAVTFELPYLESLVLDANTDLTIEFDGIANAQFLQTLVLSKTNVKALDGISAAISLEVLHLTNLGLRGPLPEELLRLTNLRSLLANFNHFTGTLPQAIGDLTGLQELLLYENDLTGAIPSTLGNLIHLQTLNLAQNALGGEIPVELDRCTELESFALHRVFGSEKGPGLSGSLPAFSSLSKIKELYLQNHQLSGTIPENFLASASPFETIKVDLFSNALTGAVPPSLLIKQRMNLYLADNSITLSSSFCNFIPPDWMSGTVALQGCDAFLCPNGQRASFGRATQSRPCTPCPGAQYWGTTTCPTTVVGSDEERAIMTEFYEKMGGRFWKNSDNWLNPALSPCSWFGIECTTDGHISAIRLRNNDMTDSGSYPSLFRLPELRILDLSANSINFRFEGIENATKLEELVLTQSDLTSLDNIGSIVSSNIRRLSLASNQLEGAVPESLFQMKVLEDLDLSHNKFSGILSSSIGLLTNLKRLKISGNSLTGALPTELGSLSDLIEIAAAENSFSGELPTSLGNLSLLQILSIRQTASVGDLTGTLPSFSGLEQLTSLQLGGNFLTGSLPVEFLQATKRGNDRIEVLLSGNAFEGSVPLSWASRFGNLVLDLAGNRITSLDDGICDQQNWNDGLVGTYGCNAILCPIGSFNGFGRQTFSESICSPCAQAQVMGVTKCGGNDSLGDEAETLIILQDLYFSTHGDSWLNNSGWTSTTDFCSWFGVTCNAVGEVVKINLENNGLTGTPSRSIYNITSLEALNFQQNAVLFSFNGIAKATNLRSLDLSSTNLDSVSGVGQSSSLSELRLTDNDLTGPFPPEILQLSNLRQLFLNFNAIEGPLPIEISLMNNLEDLFLLNNRFSGQLPASIGSLSSLKRLALSDNNFEGSIPPELNNLLSLELFAIQRENGKGNNDIDAIIGTSADAGRGLTGPLISFDRLSNLKQLYLSRNSLTGSIPQNFLDSNQEKSSIEVDLAMNRLTGAIPASLARFENMSLYLSSNMINDIPDGVCRQNNWMKGTVDLYACDAILCPPNTFSLFGRQEDASSVCETCPEGSSAPYYGSVMCDDADDQLLLGQRDVLEQLYTEADGDNWKLNDNWMNSDIEFCSWYGIECDSDGFVKSIDLMQNGLQGKIPTSVYSLPRLQEINFASNGIEISFTGISETRSLSYINLDYTGLSSLSGIEKASSLKLLHLVGNELGGVWPTEITALKSLQILYLSENDIGGALPAALAELSDLEVFACVECGLKGTLPTSVVSLKKLEYLNLSRNSFSGPLPLELESLLSLKYLSLSEQISSISNGLTGPILSFQKSLNLTDLHIHKNQLSGAIPSNFLQNVSLSQEVRIDLHSNRLNGTLPLELARFDKMTLDLADNKIEGIPQGLCEKSWNERNALPSGDSCDFILCGAGSFNGIGRASASLRCEPCLTRSDAQFFGQTSCGPDIERDVLNSLFRDLYGLQWKRADGWGSTASVCSWYGVDCYLGGDHNELVRSIVLDNNNLVGTVGSGIWLLTQLIELDLSENQIDVDFDSVGGASSLELLRLSQTNITSIVGLGSSISLRELELASLGLTGSLPEDFFKLESLERLVLDHNNLSGEVSRSIGDLSSLEELYLGNNGFSGPIPDMFGSISRLRVLSIGGNKWTGEIPSSLSFLSSLEVLSIERQPDELAGEPGLVGSLPAFHRAPRLRELYLAANSLGGTIPSIFLSGHSDKSSEVIVDLQQNLVHGAIPEVLADFSQMQLLLGGNRISAVPNSVCEMKDWMDGLLQSGCDALLCGPGTFNTIGRRTSTEDCQPCTYRASALWYGSTRCGAISPEQLTQEEILREFFERTGGNDWKKADNWLQNGITVCEWFGVDCEPNSEGKDDVVKIELSGNNLSGTIPSYMFYLPSLRVLNLSGNSVTMGFGDIKDSKSLKELYIDSTNVISLEGLNEATNLRVLKMDNTAFNGRQIPTELYSLTALEFLDIAQCGFTGTLSPSIENLSNLKAFVASHNDLSGLIPDSIASLTVLRNLLLSENNFFGPLAPLESLVSLEGLYLSARERATSGMSGTLPAFSNFPNLRNLDLGSNSLTGEIPSNFLDSVENPSGVIRILLDSNLLTGSIPSELGIYERFNIDLANNKIEGIGDGLCDETLWMNGAVGKFSCPGLLCLPGTFNVNGRQMTEDDLCNECPGDENSTFYGSTYCSALEKEQATRILKSMYDTMGGSRWYNQEGWSSSTDVCEWYGVECNEGSQVGSIALGANNLVGSLPEEIYEISGLESLWLYSNPITVGFSGIEKAKTLRSLQLDSTGLTSLDGIGGAPALSEIDVRFNRIDGKLPSELGKLSRLESFFCESNQLSGTLPKFEQNRKLISLRVGDNNFSGTLPAFNVHPKMQTLDVSENQFIGELSPNILAAADPTNPMFFDVSGNLLTGELPSGLKRFTDLAFYARDNKFEGFPPVLCTQANWNNGDVEMFGCDAILCPPQSTSPIGRASVNTSCEPCRDSTYFGSSVCNGSSSSSTVSFEKAFPSTLVTIVVVVAAVYFYS